MAEKSYTYILTSFTSVERSFFVHTFMQHILQMVGKVYTSNVCWMETISYLLNVGKMGSEHVYCTQYPMHYRQFFRCSFQLLQSIFQSRLQYYCKNTFLLNVFFFFFCSFTRLFYFLLQFLWISSHQIINR